MAALYHLRGCAPYLEYFAEYGRLAAGADRSDSSGQDYDVSISGVVGVIIRTHSRADV